VYCGRFPRAKNRDCIAQNTFHKTSEKHCKPPQNTRKTVTKRVLRNYVAKYCKTLAKTLKTSQNAHNTATIRVARIQCFLPIYMLDLSRKHTIHNTQYTRKLRGGGSRTRRGSRSRMIVDVFQKQRFAVFCGVLWCFAVFCERVFSVFRTQQHKTTAQKIYK